MTVEGHVLEAGGGIWDRYDQDTLYRCLKLSENIFFNFQLKIEDKYNKKLKPRAPFAFFFNYFSFLKFILHANQFPLLHLLQFPLPTSLLPLIHSYSTSIQTESFIGGTTVI